ncbi:patatin [Aggregicoccus sp. 17bor-14]|uniref:patatin-like phospholipase family protein n=1 Tax=Myxococcaceae TaxID=31 RepID=UPI00129C8A4D|nr:MULTISPECIES: patatin-like phospholipase family protein [Myxococcaceae]MBF5042828.1 patatin-like phospholipase family protein [Simulacricoccus sp. 17bor-14]MRI88596.1 patatin [Aggregicoccus sp. 17bor-14]
MSSPTLHAQLASKRFGLVLSAGYFGFYGHAGFLQGLQDAGLSPSAYAGTSAGGMVAAYAAGGMEVQRLQGLLLEQTRAHFWDPDPVGVLRAALPGGAGATGLLKGQRFRRLLEQTLPVDRFERLPHPLVLVGANLTRGRPEVFTQGELAPRVHATCAYPGLFRAVRLGEDLYWDGGLVDKAPALALQESAAGAGLEALLVHYLPSRQGARLGGPFAYAQGIAAGNLALRHDHFRLQLALLAARGVAVHVVVSHLPAVSPKRLEQGRLAMQQAREALRRALAEPPRSLDEGLAQGARG